MKILTEVGGAPVGRALTPEEQKRLFETGASNPEWKPYGRLGVSLKVPESD